MNQYFINNPSLKSQEIIIKYTYNNHDYLFLSDNGVFSKDALDTGSRVLLETIDFDKIKGDVLDVGCGYGPIGIIISKNTKACVDMVDVNNRAINLANKNIKLNNIENAKAFISDRYENVDKLYDLIITNPPIRVGKEILYKILKEAKDHLKENGELWFVINKHQGAKSAVNDMASVYNIDVVNKNKNFFIIRAKND